MKNTTLIIISIFIISCASTKFVPPTPTQADADRASVNYPGTTLSELNEGKIHYEANCGKCHALKKPTSKSEQQWTTIVPKMSAKANKKAGREVVTPAIQESILKYVIAMSGVKKG